MGWSGETGTDNSMGRPAARARSRSAQSQPNADGQHIRIAGADPFRVESPEPANLERDRAWRRVGAQQPRGNGPERLARADDVDVAVVERRGAGGLGVSERLLRLCSPGLGLRLALVEPVRIEMGWSFGACALGAECPCDAGAWLGDALGRAWRRAA